MNFPYADLLFWVITVNLEANKVTQIILLRAFITRHHMLGQSSCLGQHMSNRVPVSQLFVNWIAALLACTLVLWSHGLLFQYSSKFARFFNTISLPPLQSLTRGIASASAVRRHPWKGGGAPLITQAQSLWGRTWQLLNSTRQQVWDEKWRRRMYPIEAARRAWEGR